jgi:hypothetical protein
VLVSDALARIMQHIHQPLDGNFQLMPDLRVFIDKSLYLVKPMQRRFWLRSAALSDADGDLPFALKQVTTAIYDNKISLALIAAPIAGAAIAGTERFRTDHQRKESSIVLRHLLLPFVITGKATN